MKLTPCLALLLVTTLLNHQWSHADQKPPAQQKSKSTAGNPAKQLTTDRRLQKSSKDQKNDTSAEDAAPTAGDAVQLQRDFVEDALKNLSVKPDLAGKIAAEATDPATETEAKTRIHQITGAAADLDIVSANQKVRDAVIDAISRSKNPKETADKEVGQAAIDTVFGKAVTTLVPIDKLGKSVFSNLAAISGALQDLGANEDNPIVIETVKEGAKLGVTTPEAARVVFEKGAHKVLDEQGFISAKPGESLGDRLGREVEVQKKLQAELDAKKAIEAAKTANKAQLAAAAKINKEKLGRSALSQGAAGASALGESVSAKVQAGGSGGKGTTSGAGTAKEGTGIVKTQTSGIGGSQARQDAASARLAAGAGGRTNAGQPATGKQPTTNPSNDTATPATSAPLNDEQHGPQAPILEDSEFNSPASAQTPTSQQPASEKVDTPGHGAQPANNPSSSVTTPADDILIGPNQGHVKVGDDGGGVQSADGNARTTTTYFADGTYESNTVSVTRDNSGNITSTTETKTAGTWASDGAGNKQKTSTTTSTSTTRAGSGSTNNNNNNNNNGNNNQSSNDKDGDGKDDDDDNNDDDDDNNDDKKSEAPPPAEETTTDDTEAAKTEETKEASSTPDPMDIGGGDPSQLAARTGGRIGTQEARRQQRGLDLARFGGAAGPNPNNKGGAPSLLTPEEKANADRALSMRLGAGVTNPNPLGKDSVVATDRDLKDMHLRGNGGAKGPTDAQGPAKPQDPHSPIGGPTPGLAPTGGTRINGAKMKGANINGAIKVDGQVAKEAVKSLKAK